MKKSTVVDVRAETFEGGRCNAACVEALSVVLGAGAGAERRGRSLFVQPEG